MTTSGSEAWAADAPSLTVAAVARRMGVAPATLRTWDRRYGVGPSEHSPGAHRRYTPADVARLEHMRRLVIDGVPPADAARAALALASEPQAAPALREASVPSRSGGGNVLALPGSSPQARGLARAAQALDQAACQAILTKAVTDLGTIHAWNEVIVPVLNAVGDKWRETGKGVEIEHSLSAAVQDALAGRIRSLAPSTEGRTVILACAPGEQHALPLWAVAAALAEVGVGARILGANLPDDALVSAVRRLGPAAVLVWSQMEETADPRALASLPATRPPVTALIAGPGWRTLNDAAGPVRVGGLEEAVDRIRHALGR